MDILQQKLSKLGNFIRKLRFLCADYHEQLAKIGTCVKYSVDAYHIYILPFCFMNLNSRDYHADFLNVMFPKFHNSFLQFPLMLLHLSLGVSTVSSGAPLVSYFKFYVL